MTNGRRSYRPRPMSTPPSTSAPSTSARFLGTVLVLIFVLFLLIHGWSCAAEGAWLIGHVIAGIIGVGVYMVVVLRAAIPRPGRLTVMLAVLVAILLISSCRDKPTPVDPVAVVPPPPAPVPAPPVPVVPPPAPTPVDPPVTAVAPEPVKVTPPEPVRQPAFDDTQLLWERFVWSPRTGGRWCWREVAPEVWAKWSTDTAPTAPNLVRLRRERRERPGSELVWSCRWSDGSSGTRLILPTVEPTSDDFKRLDDLHQTDKTAEFVWEPQNTGTWGWRKLAAGESLPSRLRDSSTATFEYKRLVAERARIPGASLEWRAQWSDGFCGWRIVAPNGQVATPSRTMPAGQVINR